MPSTEATVRFEREAQVIAGLRSPHTVEVFDFGLADDGAFYYAMELLEGLDTDGLVRRFGPIGSDRCIQLVRQVCHSLSEAHGRGLVHRDIKPANVFVCRYGEDLDFVKVLDFGIVKASGPRDGGPLETQDHVFRGTPAFASPEQIGGAEVLDGRADLYAVGCLAYWLLTGQHVFQAKTPMALLTAHMRDVPTPPSARAEEAVPPALDDIVMACLAKDPGQRPQTAGELSRRLAEVPGGGEWTQEHARRWWETHLPAVTQADPGSGR